VREGSILAISGPSTENGAWPFSWRDWSNEPHYGLPEFWNFNWEKFDENFVKNG
jgi:hypothetical protein